MWPATGSEKRLDRSGASPHPVRMKDDGAKPPAPKGAREEKLAAALRANLRRRKAAAPAAKSQKRDEGRGTRGE